jgi:hypothetical protein
MESRMPDAPGLASTVAAVLAGRIKILGRSGSDKLHFFDVAGRHRTVNLLEPARSEIVRLFDGNWDLLCQRFPKQCHGKVVANDFDTLAVACALLAISWRLFEPPPSLPKPWRPEWFDDDGHFVGAVQLKEPPLIPVYRILSRDDDDILRIKLVFRCNGCGRLHVHGVGPNEEVPPFHRVAHCRTLASPYQEAGYRLILFPSPAPARIRTAYYGMSSSERREREATKRSAAQDLGRAIQDWGDAKRRETGRDPG